MRTPALAAAPTGIARHCNSDRGNDTASREPVSPPEWRVHNKHEDWSGMDCHTITLDGGSYRADITAWTSKPAEYRWAVFNDDGEYRVQGSGIVANVEAAKAAVEIILEVQHSLGNLPPGTARPTGSVGDHCSAVLADEMAAAICTMRERTAAGRRLNPLTGLADPFASTSVVLVPPTTALFTLPEQVRAHLQTSSSTVANRDGVPSADHVRWDTAALTPGGAFVVVDDLRGAARVMHTRSGCWFDPIVPGGGLSRADLVRWAAIVEVQPDRDGQVPDWSPTDPKGLRESLDRCSYLKSGDGTTGAGRAALETLLKEKVRDGAFTHPLIVNDSGYLSEVTNRTCEARIDELRHAVVRALKALPGKRAAFDRKTVDHVRAAATVAALGAPDVAVVLLRRRATEIRDHHGDQAEEHASELVGQLADAYLAAYSPVRAPGDRVAVIQPGERLLLLDDRDSEKIRSFRVLAALSSSAGNSLQQTAPAVNEQTGQQVVLSVEAMTVMIVHCAGDRWTDAVARKYRHSSTFLVVGPGETIPQTPQELITRASNIGTAVPDDVLVAAEKLLPVSTGSGRRAAKSPTGARRRKQQAAVTWTTVRPVPNEDQLALAQERISAGWTGMPVRRVDAPASSGFTSLEAVREHLCTITPDNSRYGQRGASCAEASIRMIDEGEVTLSAGGAFLISKYGTVAHAGTGSSMWPPSADRESPAFSDVLAGGGYNTVSQKAAAAVADMLEYGVFDGERLDWREDGAPATEQILAIRKRNEGRSLLQAAHRVAYRALVLGARKPAVNDLTMLGGMVDTARNVADVPNPEVLVRGHLPQVQRDYRSLGRRPQAGTYDTYAASTKAGETLAVRVALELDTANVLAWLSPLDAVQRLTCIADELDGQQIVGILPSALKDLEPSRTFTPAEDLRAVARVITDAYDESKHSTAARFRRANMTGKVKPTTALRITVDASWHNFTGDPDAAAQLATMIDDAGGMTFMRDNEGRLHVTFAGIDIVDGLNKAGTCECGGSMDLGIDGTLKISYWNAAPQRKRVEMVLPAGQWQLESPPQGP